MRVARELRPDHLKILRAYVMRRAHGKWGRRWNCASWLLFASALGFGVLAIPLARWTVAFPWWFAASPIVGSLFFYPIWRLLDLVAERRFLGANAAECGQQEFWTDAEGFGNSTPVGSTFHKWPRVDGVDVAPTFGFVAARGHLYMIPVGDRADEVASFVAAAQRAWTTGRKGAGEQGLAADGRRDGHE
jgi:hypothetical protein